MATPSSFTPMDAEDFLTPATTPYPTLTFSSSTNQGRYGYQYPSPSSYGEAFGNGHFTYNNSINSSSSGDTFTSSTPYQGGRPAHWDQTQPPEGMTEYGRHNLPAPAAPQAYDASSSVVDAENSLPRLRPCSSIAGSEARNLSPAPTTPGPYYTDFLDWSEENDPDNFFTQVSAREREAAEMDFGIADGMLVTSSTFHLLLLTSRFRDLSGGELIGAVAVVDSVDQLQHEHCVGVWAALRIGVGIGSCSWIAFSDRRRNRIVFWMAFCFWIGVGIGSCFGVALGWVLFQGLTLPPVLGYTTIDRPNAIILKSSHRSYDHSFAFTILVEIVCLHER